MKPLSSNKLSLVFLVLSLVLGALGGVESLRFTSSVHTAERVENKLEKKVVELDRHVAAVLASPVDPWPSLNGFKDYFVIYRYVNDTIVFWKNTFPVYNDDISSVGSFQRFVRQQNGLQTSPLAEASDHYEFMTIEGKPFLVKRTWNSFSDVVISGIDLQKLASPQLVSPLYMGKGQTVSLDGIPLFCVYKASANGRGLPDTIMLVLCILFFLAAVMPLLARRESLRDSLAFSAFIILVALVFGRRAPASFDNIMVWHALIGNFAAFFISLCLYFCRYSIKSKPVRYFVLPAMALSCFVRMVYQTVSIYTKTRLSLELYRIELLSAASMVVIVSLLLLLLCAPILIKTAFPSSDKSFGARLAFVFVSSLFMVFVPAVCGFITEKRLVTSWAESLAVERNMNLERQLRLTEPRLASDPVIAMAMDLDSPEQFIAARIRSVYFPTLSSEYEISVSVGTGQNVEGEQIGSGSRFYYTPSVGGHCKYTGTFLYYGEYTGVNTVSVVLEPIVKDGHIGSYSTPRNVFVPSRFSYAKYENGVRQFYRGNFAYPVRLTGSLSGRKYSYRHFMCNVAPGTVVVMSRPAFSVLTVIVALLLLCLLQMGVMVLVFRDGRGESASRYGYFRSRINAITAGSLAITLTVLASASAIFVYNRNEDNTRKGMVERINTARAMMQSGLDMVESLEDVGRRDLFNLLVTVSNDVNSNLSLYKPDGHLYMSASWQRNTPFTPQYRMDDQAYSRIIRSNESFAYSYRKGERRAYYQLYAPLVSQDGTVMGVLAAPYFSGDLNFGYEAIIHIATLFTLFLILLILASFFVTAVVDKLFSPLSAMGEKMKSMDLNSLESIEYDRNDEVSSLVESYNRMVQELRDSSVKLAQAERDKAWSEMARQVAHEIKNPLTPMKLQIQRVQRLRQNGDPKWEGRFDEMSKVLLDHIDVLADTANQFSSFAKLYTEEHVEIELDRLLRDEIALFAESLNVEYMGLEGVKVVGPKPQISRVIVNLLGNAVQACEGLEDPRVVVSLRHSSTEGYYDIVVEDNGPGVGEENVDKLFTPNFTTKSSGSGLGLAISRSILERCGATISYSRSILLGGACFTILYPKH